MDVFEVRRHRSISMEILGREMSSKWPLVKFSVALYVDLEHPWEACLSPNNVYPETITYFPQESEVFTGDWDNKTVSWN